MRGDYDHGVTTRANEPDDAFVEVRHPREVGWIAKDLAPLGVAPFWAPLEPMAEAKGRGGVGRLRVGDRDLVVRPYRRGGAFGKLLKDRYVRPGRAHAELDVLRRLRAEGVPVVVPVAAVARRHHAFWRLRFCTEWLPDVLPAPAFLAAQPTFRRFAAEAIGLVVRLAFAAGLRHPDLHLDNVLCSARGDKVRAVLVDLDRATLAVPGDVAAQDRMLVRMQRHIVRHKPRLAAVPTRAETMRFLRAFGLERAERHAAWRRLAEKLRRSLGRRSLIGRRSRT